MPRRLVTAALLLVALAVAASAAQRRETLIYSRFDVDPGEWRYFEFPAKEATARLEVRFEVESRREARGRGVRVRLLTDEAFGRFRENLPAEHLEGTRYRRRGGLTAKLGPGNYVLVVENRREGEGRSRVSLDVNLITGPDPETLPVAYASPQRRMAVVGVSLAAFTLILLWGGGALWRAARAHRPSSPLY
jgi:hypothetical protein